MIPNFRGKMAKDTEDAAETLLTGQSHLYDNVSSVKPAGKLSISSQMIENINFDNYIEKKIH